MAFQGNNSTTGVPDLFNLISQRRLTGMLVIAAREQDRSFFFRHGEIVYCLGNDRGHLLGDNLVRELGLDPDVIENVATTGRVRFLGEELVHRGLVEQESLNGVVERQIRSSIREVLQWDEWAFHFELQATPEDTPELGLSTQLLIFDLSRELDEWESIDEVFPELDAVLMRTAGSMRNKNAFEWRPDFPPLAEVLEDIEGSRSIRRVLSESPLPVRSHALALAELLQHDVLQLQPPIRRPDGPDAQHFLLPVVPNLPARILSLEAAGVEAPSDYYSLIQADPVLTARVMRLAKAQKQSDSENFSLHRILSRLGLQNLRSMLLVEAVRGLFLVPSSYTWHLNWEQAYSTSRACRHIAEIVGYPQLDLAQVAGLVHDIGCVAMSAENPRSYQRVYEYVRSSGVDLRKAEEQVFATNHTQVGAQLARGWGFRPELIEVIEKHHEPVRAHQEDILLNIVRLADHLMLPSGAESKITRSGLKRLKEQLDIQDTEFERIQEHIGTLRDCLNATGVLTESATGMVARERV